MEEKKWRFIIAIIAIISILSLLSLATGLLCGAIMSDHWEEISWDKKDLILANISLTWYLDGQVAKLQSSVNHRTDHRTDHRVATSSSFLVPMHGGIWIMCVSLSGTDTVMIDLYLAFSSRVLCLVFSVFMFSILLVSLTFLSSWISLFISELINSGQFGNLD